MTFDQLSVVSKMMRHDITPQRILTLSQSQWQGAPGVPALIAADLISEPSSYREEVRRVRDLEPTLCVTPQYMLTTTWTSTQVILGLGRGNYS